MEYRKAKSDVEQLGRGWRLEVKMAHRTKGGRMESSDAPAADSLVYM